MGAVKYWFATLILMAWLDLARADGVFLAKNLGGQPIRGEDGQPLAKENARIEILDGTAVIAAGQFVKDGYFALGNVYVNENNLSQDAALVVRCWDSKVGRTFDDAVAAGHGFGAADVTVHLITGSTPPVSLVDDGFAGFQLVQADPVPYWIRSEESLILPDPVPATPVAVALNRNLRSPSAVAAFRIDATRPVSFSINVQEAHYLNPLIRLFDSGGREIGRGDGLSASQSERDLASGGYLHLDLPIPGTYHLAISSRSNGAYSFLQNSGVVSGVSFGGFDLSVAQGMLGEVRTAVGPPSTPALNSLPARLQRFDKPTGPDAGLTTWVLIHGWNSNASDPEWIQLATTLKAIRPGDQVLFLDWSSIAATPWSDPYTPAAGVIPVAQWLVAALRQLGIAGTDLNFIGHSYGAYIAHAVARRYPGGVNSIVVLDPAALVPEGESPIEFRRYARSSWAFLGSPAGSDATPVTAHEAYGVHFASPFNDPNPGLTTILAAAFDGRFAYPNVFLIDRLLDGTRGPMEPDPYSFGFRNEVGTPGYEGILVLRCFPWLGVGRLAGA